jgi:hypothetical protein
LCAPHEIAVEVARLCPGGGARRRGKQRTNYQNDRQNHERSGSRTSAMRKGHFAARPFPLRLTICGVLDALSLSFKVPVIAPTTVGANFTAMLQLLPGNSGEVQVLVWVKPRVVEMLDTLSEAAPPLLRVTVLAALVVSTVRLPKLKLVGLTVPTADWVGVAVGVAVGVRLGVAVVVFVAVAVLVAVTLGEGVIVGVAVAVLVVLAVGVAVLVAVAVEVALLVAVTVGDGVTVGVVVAVFVVLAVGVAVFVAVAVGVPVAVAVAVGLAVVVAVGVGEGNPLTPNAITLAE